MQTYELLYILPGTMTEEEAKPAMDKAQEALSAAGASDIAFEHGGKNRLSYPMRHIRYGWFELAYFTAEPSAVQNLEAKLRLIPEMLRVAVREQRVGALRHLQHAFVPITREQGRFEERREPIFHAAAAARPLEPALAPNAPPVETKVESEQLQDITKKLDELLEKDLANT